MISPSDRSYFARTFHMVITASLRRHIRIEITETRKSSAECDINTIPLFILIEARILVHVFIQTKYCVQRTWCVCVCIIYTVYVVESGPGMLSDAKIRKLSIDIRVD